MRQTITKKFGCYNLPGIVLALLISFPITGILQLSGSKNDTLLDFTVIAVSLIFFISGISCLNFWFHCCRQTKEGTQGPIIIDSNDANAELAEVLNDMNYKLEEKTSALKTIQKISTIIGSYVHFDEVYHTITYAVGEFTPETACCSLWLVPDESNRPYRKSFYLDDPDISKEMLFPIEQILVKDVIANKSSELIQDFRKDSRFKMPFLEQYSMFCTTLSASGKGIGTLCVWHRKSPAKQSFSETTVEMFYTIAEQAGIAIENNGLLTAMVERQRLEKELDIARVIQKNFLPATLPIVNYASIHSCYLPANEVGGDYYDVIELPDQNLVFAINDIMGKGIPAAMFSAVTRISLHTVLESHTSPEKILEKMNSIMYEDLARARSFVTMYCAVYIHKERKLLYSNAGHNYPILFRISTGKCEPLKVKGVFLGGLPHNQYELRSVNLEIGDIVVFFTDGLKEANNKTGAHLGMERVLEVITQNALLDAEQIASEILIEVFKFIKDHPQSDDLTLIVFKIIQ